MTQNQLQELLESEPVKAIVEASEDLGFTVKPILAPSEKQPQIAITSPDTFDVFGGYNYQSLLVWPSGSLQPGDVVELEIDGIGVLRNRIGTKGS